MTVKFAGEHFDLNDNQRILTINSPQSKIKERMHVVVHKNMEERWVIVALDYSDNDSGNPRLGLRWFWDTLGYPNTMQYATWIILPVSLSEALLNGKAFGLSQEKISLLKEFLDSKISGSELRGRWKNTP